MAAHLAPLVRGLALLSTSATPPEEGELPAGLRPLQLLAAVGDANAELLEAIREAFWPSGLAVATPPAGGGPTSTGPLPAQTSLGRRFATVVQDSGSSLTYVVAVVRYVEEQVQGQGGGSRALVPLAVCVWSAFPELQLPAFFDALARLSDGLAAPGGSAPRPAAGRAFAAACAWLVREVPMPPAGASLLLHGLDQQGPLIPVAAQPPSLDFPFSHAPLQLLLERLGVQELLLLLRLTLLEQQVLLRSSSTLVLTAACETLARILLFPLTWQHGYNPLVSQVSLLGSKGPWLFGLQRQVLELGSGALTSLASVPGDEEGRAQLFSVFDLDTGEVEPCHDLADLPPWPGAIQEQLRLRLSELRRQLRLGQAEGAAPEAWDTPSWWPPPEGLEVSPGFNSAVQRALFLAMAALLADAREHLLDAGARGEEEEDFDVHGFVASRPADGQRFARALAETVAFQEHLAELREEAKGAGAEELEALSPAEAAAAASGRHFCAAGRGYTEAAALAVARPDSDTPPPLELHLRFRAEGAGLEEPCPSSFGEALAGGRLLASWSRPSTAEAAPAEDRAAEEEASRHEEPQQLEGSEPMGEEQTQQGRELSSVASLARALKAEAAHAGNCCGPEGLPECSGTPAWAEGLLGQLGEGGPAQVAGPAGAAGLLGQLGCGPPCSHADPSLSGDATSASARLAATLLRASPPASGRWPRAAVQRQEAAAWPPRCYRHRLPALFAPSAASSCGPAPSVATCRAPAPAPAPATPAAEAEAEASDPEPLVLNPVHRCLRSVQGPCVASAELVVFAFRMLQRQWQDEAVLAVGSPQRRRSSALGLCEAVAGLRDEAEAPRPCAGSPARVSRTSLCAASPARGARSPLLRKSWTGADAASPSWRSTVPATPPPRVSLFGSPARSPERAPGPSPEQLEELRLRFGALRECRPSELGQEERLAFWLNVLNAAALAWLCVDRASLASGFFGSPWPAFLQTHHVNVGGHNFSLAEIEQSVLRAQSALRTQPSIAPKLGWGFRASARGISADSPRHKMVLEHAAPEAAFGIAYPVRAGCPPLRVYWPETVKLQLLVNCAHYAACSLEAGLPRRRLTLPAALRLPLPGFGTGPAELLASVRAVLVAVPGALESAKRLAGRRASRADAALAARVEGLAAQLEGAEGGSQALAAGCSFAEVDWTFELPRQPPVCPELEGSEQP